METGSLGTSYTGKAIVRGLESGEEIELDWGLIGVAFDTLLKLAPAELRSPPERLCRLYEQRRAICNLIISENKSIEEEIKNAGEEIFKAGREG